MRSVVAQGSEKWDSGFLKRKVPRKARAERECQEAKNNRGEGRGTIGMDRREGRGTFKGREKEKGDKCPRKQTKTTVFLERKMLSFSRIKLMDVLVAGEMATGKLGCVWPARPPSCPSSISFLFLPSSIKIQPRFYSFRPMPSLLSPSSCTLYPSSHLLPSHPLSTRLPLLLFLLSHPSLPLSPSLFPFPISCGRPSEQGAEGDEIF